MNLAILSLCLLLSSNLVSSGGWGSLLGKNRWAGMKHTSSTGRFLHKHVTKGKMIKSALTSTISTLGLFGSLALFKQIENAIDPSDIIHSMIDQINTKIKNKKSEVLGESMKLKDEPFDFIWLLIAIPCLATSCLCSCFCLSLIKKIIRLGFPDTPDPVQTSEIELKEDV